MINDKLNSFADVLVTLLGPKDAVASRFSSMQSTKIGPFQLDAGHRGRALSHCYTIDGSTYVLLGEVYRFGGQEGVSEALFKAFCADWSIGQPRFHQLDGQFALFRFEHRTGAFEVATDPMGTVHVYVGRSGKRVGVGTCFLQLAEFLGGLDWDHGALRTFFEIGFYLDRRTHFREIEIIPPGVHLSMNLADRYVSEDQSCYWEWPRPRQPTWDEAVATYDQLFVSAVRRRSSDATVIPVSGGLDSRCLLAVSGRDQPKFTYGYGPRSLECQIARAACASAGSSCRTLYVRPNFMERHLAGTAATEGFQDLLQARQLSEIERIGELGAYSLSGMWGDVWHDVPHNNGPARGFFPLSSMRKRGGEELVRIALGFASGANQAGEEDIELTGFGGRPDLQYKVFKTRQWAFRWSNTSLRVFQLGIFPRCPFYDADLVRFLMSLPAEYVKDRRLQIRWLRDYHDNLASVVWQQSLRSLTESELLGKVSYWRRRILFRLLRQFGVYTRKTRNCEVQFENRARDLEDLIFGGFPFSVDEDVVCMLIRRMVAKPDAATCYVLSMMASMASFGILLRQRGIRV